MNYIMCASASMSSGGSNSTVSSRLWNPDREKFLRALTANAEGQEHSNIGPFAYRPEPVLRAWMAAAASPEYARVIKTEVQVIEELVIPLQELLGGKAFCAASLGSGAIEQVERKEGLLLKAQKDCRLVTTVDLSKAVRDDFMLADLGCSGDRDTSNKDFLNWTDRDGCFTGQDEYTQVVMCFGFTPTNLMVRSDASDIPEGGYTDHLKSIRNGMRQGDLLVITCHHDGDVENYSAFSDLWRTVFMHNLDLPEDHSKIKNMNFFRSFCTNNRILAHDVSFERTVRVRVPDRSTQLSLRKDMDLNTSLKPKFDTHKACLNNANFDLIHIANDRNEHVSGLIVRAM